MRSQEHQDLHRDKIASVQTHRKIATNKRDHQANLRAKPPATDSDGFKAHAMHVAAAAEACRLTGRTDLVEILTGASHKLWYLSL